MKPDQPAIASLLWAAMLAGCHTPASPVHAAAAWTIEAGPPLPEPIANNAVASSRAGGRDQLFTFLGLGAAKDFRAITRHAYALDLRKGVWERLPDVPGDVGRIAATAQSVGAHIYLFGGYSVAEDGKETTHATVEVYDVAARRYSRGSETPVPVDDAVSGVWRDRLIFLIGGWSRSDNVDAVQVYDPATDKWRRATSIPGTPVFGHAGAIAGDVIVYCGGARVQAPRLPKYVANAECYRGDIDPRDPTQVAWRLIAHHPGPPRYRAAAGAIRKGGMTGVMFVGGASSPYNYNAVGYDGRPVEPLADAWIYDIHRDTWSPGPHLSVPSMDHRGLLSLGGFWWMVGGFGSGQAVSKGVTRLGSP